MSNSQHENKNGIIDIDNRIDNIIKDNMHLLDILQKIVVNMFKTYKDNLTNKTFNNNHTIDDQKSIVAKFEKVIKCIRYQKTNTKDFYNKIDDDLELLIQLSQVSSISIVMKELVDEYLRIYKMDTLKINTYKKNNTDNIEFIDWLKLIGIELDLKEGDNAR